jgi:hypothetical protein
MENSLKLDILPNGRIKFNRGDKEYNEKMKSIIFDLVNGDEDIMQKLDCFLKGSEEIELLVGDTIFCG